jgi:hypothetical protein
MLLGPLFLLVVGADVWSIDGSTTGEGIRVGTDAWRSGPCPLPSDQGRDLRPSAGENRRRLSGIDRGEAG